MQCEKKSVRLAEDHLRAWNKFNRTAKPRQYLPRRRQHPHANRLITLRLLRSILGATGSTTSNTTLSITISHLPANRNLLKRKETSTYQIHSTTNQVILHTRTIRSTTPTNLDHTVLLDIVSLAGDDGGNDLARTQPYTGRLALARIGLLGLCDAGLQTHALHRRVIFQRGRARPPRPLAFPAAALHLVVGCADDWRAGESPLTGCLEGEGCLGAEDGLEGPSGCRCGLSTEGLGGGRKRAERCRQLCRALDESAQGPKSHW